MTNSEQFVKYYTSLENAVSAKFSTTVEQAANNELIEYRETLHTLRSFRNVLSHSRPFGLEYCAEAHDKMLNTLKFILTEVDDSVLYKNCVLFDKICWATMEDSVIKYMNLLKDNVYTHIPILDDKRRVIGVFGESTLFNLVLSYANKNDFPVIDENLKFKDIAECIKLENHMTETFAFMSRYDTLTDVRYEFKKSFDSAKKRLGMIFITNSGKPTESLLGIITSYGLLRRESY